MIAACATGGLTFNDNSKAASIEMPADFRTRPVRELMTIAPGKCAASVDRLGECEVVTMHEPRASADGKRVDAFTITELLVVIGIIAVLIALFLPALNGVRQQSQAIKCKAQLCQIGAAVQMYVSSYGGVLNWSKYGPNWLTTATGTSKLIENQGTRAYWGVAYAPFLIPVRTLTLTGTDASKIEDTAKGIWHCPSSLTNDPSFGTASDAPTSYGINGFVTGSSLPRWRRITRYKNTSAIVFAQDSIKSQMNGAAADTLSSFGGDSNLTAWRRGGAAYALTTAGVSEYFRHRGNCNVLWLDDHVDSVAATDGRQIPREWYQPVY